MSVSVFVRAKRLPDLESINLNNLQGNVLETKYGQFRTLNTSISFRGEAAVRDTGNAYSRVPIAIVLTDSLRLFRFDKIKLSFTSL